MKTRHAKLENEEEVVRALIDGDSGAFLKFYLHFDKLVVRPLFRIHVDDWINHIDDFSQNFWQTLYTGRFDLDRRTGDLIPWMFQRVKWRLGDYFRRHQRQSHLEYREELPRDAADESVEAPDERAQRLTINEIRIYARQLFRRLRAPQRVVMELVAQSKEPAEIATILGLNVEVVYLRKNRAQRTLRKLRDKLPAA